jgi:hypothetical protein
VLQADVRPAIELSREVSRDKLSDRAGRIVEPHSGHTIAEMIRAVIPTPIRAMCKKKMIQKAIVETVA